jgi:multidrug transporter EmrE-like cation transporter
MPKLSKWMMPLAGAIVCLLLLGPALALTFRGITDFIDLYAGAKLTFTGDQYNVARVLATEAHTTGFFSATRLFMRMPVFGLLLWPIAQMPYSRASPIWEGLCVLAIAAVGVLWPAKRARVIAACCWSLPVWMTLAEGQDVAFLLLWLALATIALCRKRSMMCGLILSLCLAKYHLFLLLPVWLIVNRLGRIAAGLTIGSAVLVLASFIAGGAGWPQRYFALLREPTHNPYPGLMPNLHGVFADAPALELTAAVVVAVLACLAMRKLDVLSGLAVVLMGGILIAPHDYMADCALLVPAAILLLERRRRIATRVLLLWLLTPIPYAALMLGASWMIIGPSIALLTLLVFDRESAPAIQPQSEQCPSGEAHSPA